MPAPATLTLRIRPQIMSGNIPPAQWSTRQWLPCEIIPRPDLPPTTWCVSQEFRGTPFPQGLRLYAVRIWRGTAAGARRGQPTVPALSGRQYLNPKENKMLCDLSEQLAAERNERRLRTAQLAAAVAALKRIVDTQESEQDVIAIYEAIDAGKDALAKIGKP
jgi:hypothetical protein